MISAILPSLVVGYLGFTSLSRRRDAARKLYGMSLFLSGEAALKSIEDRIRGLERDRLAGGKDAPSDAAAGRVFLLDADFRILNPEIAEKDEAPFSCSEGADGRAGGSHWTEAEKAEFQRKDFRLAAELYGKAAAASTSDRCRALARMARGRCRIALRDYAGALADFDELAAKYGRLTDASGHPFGIIAAMRSADIEGLRGNEDRRLSGLIELRRKMDEGAWPLDLAGYHFFRFAIEAILEPRIKGHLNPDLEKSYQQVKERATGFLEDLRFRDLLQTSVVLRIKEASALDPSISRDRPGRLFLPGENGSCLVSFAPAPRSGAGGPMIAGVCWDAESLLKRIVPSAMEGLDKSSGVTVSLTDRAGKDILSERQGESAGLPAPAAGTISFSFREFPLPFKLIVSQPAMLDFDRAAVRENVFYGLLILIVVGLMALGAGLVVRDISREAQLTARKTEFVHTISHELKTPLTLIRLYAETLEQKPNLGDPEKKDALKIIAKESERLSHLINNVLDFSRIEMGRKEFDFRIGDLATVVRETVASYRYHLEKKGFLIREEITADCPAVRFDREAMASVVVNLLSNAIKFSPREKDVGIRLSIENGWAVLRIADKGSGIAPADLPRIFDKFYRGGNDLSGGAGGSGLGLTLVKHIVEAHGGRVEARSEGGKGSEFSVYLPILAEPGGEYRP
ncbi:MAG: ATP-binding protein [Candidatus Aminicenantes bacterium]|nr:ATP-binding protein [Candidatus Aminicenantes bacterium]